MTTGGDDLHLFSTVSPDGPHVACVASVAVWAPSTLAAAVSHPVRLHRHKNSSGLNVTFIPSISRHHHGRSTVSASARSAEFGHGQYHVVPAVGSLLTYVVAHELRCFLLWGSSLLRNMPSMRRLQEQHGNPHRICLSPAHQLHHLLAHAYALGPQEA